MASLPMWGAGRRLERPPSATEWGSSRFGSVHGRHARSLARTRGAGSFGALGSSVRGMMRVVVKWI